MPDLMKLACPAAVAGFGIYNSVVVSWELRKKDSQVCPKCAYTRFTLGLGLSAFAVYIIAMELV